MVEWTFKIISPRAGRREIAMRSVAAAILSIRADIDQTHGLSAFQAIGTGKLAGRGDARVFICPV